MRQLRSIFGGLAAAFFVAVLAGCGLTPQGDMIRATVADKGAQVADEGLTNAEWFLCQAASVGSVKRRYGRNPEASKAYANLCASAYSAGLVPGLGNRGSPGMRPPASPD